MSVVPGKDLKSIISSKSKEIANILSKDFRDDLNKNTHILDISYNALKVNVYQGDRLSKREIETYTSIYAKLIDVVTSSIPSSRTFLSITDIPKDVLDTLGTKGVILVNGGNDNIFIVGNSFDSIRKFVTSKISNNSTLRGSRFGSVTTFTPEKDAKGRNIPDSFKKTTKSKLDIGHIPMSNNENLTSPLEQKLLSVLAEANTLNNPRLAALVKKGLEDLYSVQANFQYNFKNTAPEAIASARKTLGTGYVVVTLHTSKKNNEFSAREHAIYFNLLKDIASSIDYASIPGSNNIYEDITQAIVNIIRTGKSSLKGHTAKNVSDTIKIKSKASTNISSPVVELNQSKAKAKPTDSLSSLQVLLNRHLQDVISANMGDGNDKRILNYRTGRFAASAKVERLTQSREGAITAFYSYMKYPYATFSEGGQQQYPRTRDPKLLVSKSIREIAQTITSNSLRSVAL